MSEHCKRGIILGYPFDQLFDKDCPLEPWRSGQSVIPAIKLPWQTQSKEVRPGTGNIIICGPPGSGKSTLALEWAMKCAYRNENRSNSIYISLETGVEEVIAKAEPFGWHKWLRAARFSDPVDEFSDAKACADSLHALLHDNVRDSHAATSCGCSDEDDPTRRVLICSLSPRPLKCEDGLHHSYWRRYGQLERLLRAAKDLSDAKAEALDTETANPPSSTSRSPGEYGRPGPIILPVIVIDSLNMFGSRPLTREEVFLLFSLFRKYRRIGVFTVESSQDTLFDSTMADVVVSLTNEKDRGYYVQHFEIQKSRYFDHIRGLHPYKPVSRKESERNIGLPQIRGLSNDPRFPREGVLVYPSLHYIVLRTEGAAGSKRIRERAQEPSHFGIGAFRTIFPRNLSWGDVVTIAGPRGTFKSSFALNFLAAGLCSKSTRMGSGIYIRFSDVPLLNAQDQPPRGMIDPPRLSVELNKLGFRWDEWAKIDEDEGALWSNLAGKQKTTISVWKRLSSSGGDAPDDNELRLFEIDFKGGMLLPEEFIDIIRGILIRWEIGRVVLDDVSQIGVSYPFLQHSTTTGDMFLSAFVHIMRNAGVDLVMTGTTSGLPAADDIVRRACSLADTVLSCQFCDVFGDRYIIVRGEGMIAGKPGQERSGESVPGTVILDHEDAFRVDPECLEGLVGFETGHIYRPGVAIHLFEENELVHREYNREIREMLQSGLASWAVKGNADDRGGGQRSDAVGEVVVRSFQPGDSEAIHDSLDILRDGAPVDKTVLLTVDEFCAPSSEDDPGFDRARRQWVQADGVEQEDDVKKRWAEVIHAIDECRATALRKVGLWPFYANVLLLAYRTDVSEVNAEYVKGILYPARLDGECDPHRMYPRMRSWTDVRRLLGCLGSDERRPFWIDLSAHETFSCILLDALAAARAGAQKTFSMNGKVNFPVLDDEGDLIPAKAIAEVTSLGAVLKTVDRSCVNNASLLPGDASVYVCWYSQLRELLRRCPRLTDRIGVCALPGGGFRGDWFIGIVHGSVSPQFGRRIVQKLCSTPEEYKRFVQGVGLPVHRSYYTSPAFPIWPGANRKCLDKAYGLNLQSVIFPILANAWWRQDIRDYQKIRSAVHGAAHEMLPWTGGLQVDDTANAESFLRDLVSSVRALRGMQ